MTTKKAVILLVHGAWHRPIHYIHIIEPLRAMGYTVVAPSLVTAGFDKSTSEMTIADDVKVIRDAMATYLDRDDEIVVVCHSYGGLPGTDSVIGQTITERRERGLAGGIKTVVYLAAFAPPASRLASF